MSGRRDSRGDRRWVRMWGYVRQGRGHYGGGVGEVRVGGEGTGEGRVYYLC